MNWGFGLGLAALSLLAAGFVAYPWLVRRGAADATLAAHLREGYRLRREELQRDVEAGWLAPELFGEAEAELDRGLLADENRAPAAAAAAPAGRRAGWGLAALAVAAALALLPVSSELVRVAWFAGPPDAGEQSARLEARLQARTEAAPEDVAAWRELGAFLRERGRAAEAQAAWLRANELTGFADPGALVGLADAMAAVHGDVFPEQAVDYLLAALAVDPAHQKALWLAGWAAWQRDQAAAAVAYWERLEAALPAADAELRAMVRGWIAEARGEAAAAGPSLEVTVRLAPALAAALDPDAALFVTAARVDGPPMPLAVWRGRAGELPVQVTLDDRAAMAPGMGLSQARAVRVKARVSRAGLAEARSGDLVGETGPVPVAPAVAVEVLIERKLP